MQESDKFVTYNGRRMPRACGGDGTVTIDDVASSVAQLTDAVKEMREGTVDRETVERIASDVVTQNSQVRGYTPPPVSVDHEGNPIDVEREVLGGTARERIQAALSRPAVDVAPILRREVGDIEQLQERADNLLLVGTVLQGRNKIQSIKEMKYYSNEFLPSLRAAFDTQTASEGQEFVPTELSSQLIDRVALLLRVLGVIAEVSMPTNPFELPAMALSRTRGGSHAEQTADSGQTNIKKITAGSRKVTLTATKFATEILTSKEAEEDSIIAVLPFLREELEDFTAADLEDTAINGDTAGTHRDSDSTGSDDPRGNWDGIRKVANANSAERDHGGGDLDVAGLRANRKLMGKYGVSPGNLVHVIGITGYIDLLSDTKVETIDKYGPRATVLTGELGRADGVPLIVSEFVREDLTAAGIHDGVTTDFTVAATVHRRAFLRGTRRTIEVEFLRELYSESDQDAVKISTRQALSERYTGDPAVAVSRNVDST